jgi:hypothetical protein
MAITTSNSIKVKAFRIRMANILENAIKASAGAGGTPVDTSQKNQLHPRHSRLPKRIMPTAHNPNTARTNDIGSGTG